MAWMNGRRTVRCRHCWEKGHNIRNCPTIPQTLKDSYKAGDKARKCSYCNNPGHNKASCTERKSDIAAYKVQNAEYRANVLNQMIAFGIGVGSLVTHHTDTEGLTGDKLFMITDVAWNKVQAKNQWETGYFLADALSEDGWSPTMHAPWSEGYYKSNVLTKRTEEQIRATVPEGWLNGEGGFDKYF